MAEGSCKDAAKVFQKTLPRLCTPLAREPNFTNVTNFLFGEELITKQELEHIKTKGGLDGNQRGSDVAHLLLEKINADKDPVQYLLTICKILQEKEIGDEKLKEYSAKMMSQVTAKTMHASIPPTTTITTAGTASGTDLLDITDVRIVMKVLEEVLFSSTHWMELGLDLGLHIHNLNVIEAQKGDCKTYLRKCIEAWLSQEDKVMENGGPKWQTLIRAVKSTGDNAAASKIPEKLTSLYNIKL